MSSSLDASGSRRARLTRSRSRRVVQIVQKTSTEDIIAVVKMSGDGPSMHFEESATFRVIHNATGAEEVQSSCEATDSSDDSHESTQYLDVPRPSRKDSSPVFFDASTDDGSIYSFYDYEADAGNTGDVQDSVTADVFSDDEFGPINMSFSKRPPTPLTRPRPLRIEVHANKSLPPSPTSFTSHMQRSSLGASSACDSESMSRSTLYSLDSCATSVTCVTQNQDTKFIGRSYYDSEKSDERKFNDADAPKSATEPQKMVDLQSVGYDFSWSRFIPRSEAALYMRPEDQVDMEVHVPRGPNFFPTPGPFQPKVRRKQSNLEKKILGVFKKRVA